MTKILESLDQILWGAPALLGILGVGVFLSIRSGFPQFSLFTRAWKTFLHSLHGKENGNITLDIIRYFHVLFDVCELISVIDICE